MKREEFLKHINAMRLQNKGKWIFYTGEVEGKLVGVKSYNTYLQQYIVEGKRMESGRMDMSVSDWKTELAKGV